MPPKAASELTQIEVSVLTIAARLLAAIRSVSDNPPTDEQLAHYNSKVIEELVSA